MVHKLRVGLWIAALGLLVWSGIIRLDPDYGWHIAMGKHIAEQGIPKTDPFSFTMPSYPFIDHEWLTNFLMYKADGLMDKDGMAVFFGILTTLAMGVSIWKRKNILGWEATIIMLLSILWARSGVRPQVISWLFVAILFRLFGERKLWEKLRWFVPIWFVLWTNLHGGFAIGLAILGWMVFWKSLQERKIDWKDAGVCGLSILATAVNPYGLRIWHEIWMQFTDSDLRWTIAEWQPFYTVVEFGFWYLGTLAGFLMYKFWRKIEWWKTTTVLMLLIAGIGSLRHIALFGLVAVPFVGEMIFILLRDLNSPVADGRAKKIYKGLLLISVIPLVISVAFEMLQKNQVENWYPVKAIEYLRSKNVDGNIFSEYGWGGYLDWKYPEKKVFIDGRMPSWRWTSPNSYEADWAMKDYLKVVRDVEYVEVFEKYDIDTVLLPKSGKDNLTTVLSKAMERWLLKLLGQKVPETKVNLIDKLKEDGWKNVYEDNAALLLVKKELK